MKRLLSLIVILILGLGGGAFFNLVVSPDNQWLLKLHQIKSAALQKSPPGNRTLVVGGSSVLFGIDAGQLEKETGRPSVNLGFSASLGAFYLLGYAEEAAQPGDLVVLSLEPNLLSKPPAITRDTAVIATRLGRRDLIFGGREGLTERVFSEEISSWLAVTTPGLRRIVNYGARCVLHLPVFRYTGKRIDEYGYAVEKVTLPHAAAEGGMKFDPGWKPILQTYRERMQRRGIQVVYRLSWCEVVPEKLPEVRTQMQSFLDEVAQALPVLVESDLGLKTDPALFSDFQLHLSNEGARQSTSALAGLINHSAISNPSTKP